MPRRGHDSGDFLFTKYDFHSVEQMQTERLKKAINAAEAALVQQGSVDEAAERFASEFRFQVPQLTEGATSVDVEEVRVDVSRDINYGFCGGGAAGIRANYFVPFSGDPGMFKLKPNTYTYSPPTAAVEKNELRFTFERAGQAVGETKTDFERELTRVKEYLRWLAENVKSYNDSLLPLARQEIQARRTRLAEMHSGTSSLGIPIRSASPAVRISAPSSVRSAPQGSPA